MSDKKEETYVVTPLGVMTQMLGREKAREVFNQLASTAVRLSETGTTPAMIFNGGGSFVSLQHVDVPN